MEQLSDTYLLVTVDREALRGGAGDGAAGDGAVGDGTAGDGGDDWGDDFGGDEPRLVRWRRVS